MKKILLLLLIPVIISGQNKFSIDVDYATFPFNQKTGFIEIYYAFPQSCLTITKTDSVRNVGGILNIKMNNLDSNKLILNKSWKFKSKCDTGNISRSLIGLLRFQLEVGKYNCSVTGTDINDSSAVKVIKFDFAVKPLDSLNVTISDIEVSSGIVQESNKTNSVFYKNTMEITPNASGIFGINFPVLFFYSELYNVNKGKNAEHLKVDHLLVNANNKKVYAKTKFITRNNSSVVDVGAIKVNKFPTGVYNLIVACTDTVSNFSIASLKKIYIYNPGILDTTVNQMKAYSLLTTELAVMSNDELNKMFAESKYIANSLEIKKWDKISTIEGKRRFLQRFWKTRDEDTSTPQNEAMTEYFERVKYADEHFKNISRKEGWMTDMGRVYIVYGEPYEIERHPNDLSLKPYEIWFYDKMEGGVIFAFGDQTGFGDYRLLHSTKRGELEDPNWKQKLDVR